MMSIADATSKAVLKRLVALVEASTISAVEAWGCFTAPKPLHTFKRHTLTLTGDEVANLESLRDKVQQILKKRINKRCAYCKRAMGQHGMSWHIEHIYGKTRFHRLMFTLSNLTYACIDCNLVKNNSVDQSNPYLFDIINPNLPNFRYGRHLNFLQLSTEELHILKYQHHSPEGESTYRKLKLQSLEHLEVVSSLNESVRHLSERIDSRLSDLIGAGEHREVAEFLHKLKLKITEE